jgi:hypothetical protein
MDVGETAVAVSAGLVVSFGTAEDSEEGLVPAELMANTR